MKPIMRTARYRSKAAAQRYANELTKLHPGSVFTVVPHPFDFFYSYAVQTMQANGRPAYAARRPIHFERFLGGKP